MPQFEQVVVLGGSLAGLRAVEALRRRGHDGRIVWIGAEVHQPYDRPPLSKQLLDGTWTADRVFFRKNEGYDALSVECRFGRRATALDPTTKIITLDDGECVPYDGLVIATGAVPRRLPGMPPLGGVFTLRALDDAIAIADRLSRNPRVAVVGAGFIGLEVAASCRKRGLDVTVIETLHVPLLRAIGETLGQAVEDVHRDHGVALVTSRSVAALEGTGDVTGLRLSDGSLVEADLVVVGIGVTPQTDFLGGSGLRLNDGVLCDSQCAASAPDIVAAGDVARWHHVGLGESIRVEHWTNAVEQANAAVERLLVGPEAAAPFTPVPYFWSDQYDVKIQFVGRYRPDDEVHMLERQNGSPRRLVALCATKGVLSGALVFNRPAIMIRCRKLIAEGATVEAAVENVRSILQSGSQPKP